MIIVLQLVNLTVVGLLILAEKLLKVTNIVGTLNLVGRMD